MKNHKLYSLRDSKAEVYNPPQIYKTDGEATRSLHKAVNDPATFVNRYPEDYDLYQIGEFDEDKGRYINLDAPRHVCKAITLKQVGPTEIQPTM